MKNSTYWKHRFEQLEQAANQEGAAFYQSIESQYYQAQKTIENQIRAWYQRFAVNNQISMEEARKLLTSKELKEFKWDVQDYIKYGEENALDAVWMKELENASARYHISRLEALKLQTQQSMEVLFGNQTDGLDSLMKQIYSDGYYHTAFEIQKGFGVGWGVASIDQNRLEKIISKPWAADGKNFSDRIWQNKTKLTNELHTELTQMCMLGKPPDTAIKNIAKSMNTSKVNAGRLVMTESAYFASAAQKDSFEDLDVEQFEIVATLDSHTSEICQEMDGKVFPMKDYEPGVTAPPFHVWCRSTTVPYFDDEFNVGERAARGEDGKTYYVPDSMKYPEWKKSFVDGDTDGLQEADANDIMKGKKEEVQALKETIMKKHEGILTDAQKTELDQILSGHDSRELTLYDRLSEFVQSNDYHFKRSGAAYYPGERKVKMNLDSASWEKAVGTGQTGAWKTKFHEEFHQLDHLLSRTDFALQPDGTINPFQYICTHFTGTNTVIGQRMIQAIDGDLIDAINMAVDWRNQDRISHGLDPIFKHLKSLSRIPGDTGESLLYYLKAKYNTPKLRAQIDMFTDAMGLTTKNRLAPHGNGFWGHDAAYNKDRGKDGATSETWATFGSLFFSADEETKEVVKALMPKTWETYESVLNEVIDYAQTNGFEY